VQVRDEHCHVETGVQEVRELSHRGEMSDVHLAGRRVADVDRRRALGKQFFEFVGRDDLLGVARDEVEPIHCVHRNVSTAGPNKWFDSGSGGAPESEERPKHPDRSRDSTEGPRFSSRRVPWDCMTKSQDGEPLTGGRYRNGFMNNRASHPTQRLCA